MAKVRQDVKSLIRRHEFHKATKIDSNKGCVDKTSWEKLQKFDKVTQVTPEYRSLLQLSKLDGLSSLTSNLTLQMTL